MDAASAAIAREKPVSIDGLLELAKPDMAKVDALIRDRMQSPVSVIPALAEHLIGGSAKRLRPLLTIAAARVAGAQDDACLKLAAAVEFIHTATLLHDDVVDSSQLRRGKVAAHLIWGAPASVLVGDFLFARAFELMVEAGSMQALEILARASRVIAEGEVLQLTRAHDLNLSQDLYLEIIKAKTAELFAAAAEAGAVSAGASPEGCEALRRFGQDLGLAFQLVDDALDYSGDAATLGKNAGDDFREGKATLPLLLAIAKTGAAEKPFWDRTVGRREQTDEDFERARGLVASTGADAATLALAGDYAATAKAQLADFASSNSWRSALEDLADFAVQRKS
ncbi:MULTISPECIES: polyprenyl synthetase family protein [unclassified Phenylobacterium]|uniref:polyprenyl synthetase family protein n=1 Tax=unclassified Phenylobacterium TaxID=2640670 RepID=UPI0022B37747|nr:polyprenyl synthetase family protein [Phenylobacterium sp. NIBR 498073]WGU41623.1 polyprenyl synthetase family protein [Phenylobacterium sp. NIBR 498073]